MFEHESLEIYEEHIPMPVVRGIVVVIACGVLSAIGGGVTASALNWLAPSYYPGVFPHASEATSAAEIGVGTGIIQGAWR